nr:cyclase family protein [uncultured Dethiosulfovibrio sp.]
MKAVDLTYTVEEGMPVYPGTEPPVIVEATTVAVEGFAEKLLTLFSHTGTHMDAPAHMLKDGSCLDEMDVNTFMGKAVVADVKDSVVDVEDLIPFRSDLDEGDYLILRTGWSRFWGTDDYFGPFPVLSEEAAKWISERNLKGIGVDAISVDPVESTTLPNHLILLGSGMVIVENLTNLEKLPQSFTFLCLPLKIGHADGAPIRAVGLL